MTKEEHRQMFVNLTGIKDEKIFDSVVKLSQDLSIAYSIGVESAIAILTNALKI